MNSDLEQVFAENHGPLEVRASGVEPHLVCDGRIIRRHEMREHQHLDACSLRYAAGLDRAYLAPDVPGPAGVPGP